MPEWGKDLLKAFGAVSLVVLVAILFRPPKFDAIVKANDPKLYVPLLSLFFLLWVAIIYKGFRKR